MIGLFGRTLLEIEKEIFLKKALANRSKKELNIETPRNILCIQMNAIGDAIMTQPAWEMLKSNVPGASIDLICRPHIAPIFTEDSAIDSIFTFENHRYRSWKLKDYHRLENIWLKKNYDIIIDFTALPLTAAICAIESTPPSIGFQRPANTLMGDINLGFFYDKSVPYSEKAWLRDLMLLPISLLTNQDIQERFPVIRISADKHEMADLLLKQKGIENEKYIVIHPGAKWPPKRWPISYWRDLIEQLLLDDGRLVLILGGKADSEIVRAIRQGFDRRYIRALICDDLAVSSAIIKQASICLCNDSAAMHIAAAVGTRSVALFGPVSPERSAPIEEEGCSALYEKMFCSPCTLYYSREKCRRGINFCMYAIKPEMVYEKTKRVICQTD